MRRLNIGEPENLAHLPQIGDGLFKKWGLTEHYFQFNFDPKKTEMLTALSTNVTRNSIPTLVKDFPFADSKGHSLIFSMIPVALSNVPFHQNTKSIKRFFTEDFPIHLAVHEVSPVSDPPEEYTVPHIHEDWDEINLIISQHDLLYRIQLEDEQFTVSNNSSIWIPRGTKHSANVLKGSGYFITIRLD